MLSPSVLGASSAGGSLPHLGGKVSERLLRAPVTQTWDGILGGGGKKLTECSFENIEWYLKHFLLS